MNMKDRRRVDSAKSADSAVPPAAPDYELVAKQVVALSEEDAHWCPLLANASALIMDEIWGLNWVGFYLLWPMTPATDANGFASDSAPEASAASVTESAAITRARSVPDAPTVADFEPAPARQLVLGPFQGKVACVHITPGRGVCGAAVAQDTTQLVPDVHAFPGHIACDSASRSEVVVPLHAKGCVIGVLDVDSPQLARFSAEDAAGFEAVAHAIEQHCDFAELLG